MKNEKFKLDINKSFIDFFNTDKFIDETLIIFDFKGNILVSGREFRIIDFFADFSDVKLNLFDIIDPSYQDTLNKRLAELKKGNSVPPAEYKLAERNYKSAYVEVFSKPVTYGRKKAILALIRDITFRKETEKNLLYTIVQTEEKERQRFARDLHDELGPFLSGLKLYLYELQASSASKEKRKVLIEYLTQMIDEAVDKVRMIASNLTPQNMIDIGLAESVNKMIGKLNQSGQISIKLETEGHETGIESSFTITLYRIILELINNSLKHAESKNISILLIYKKKTIRLIYRDDGKGFDLEKELSVKKGIGLKSIFHRMELYQGSFKFTNLPAGGIEFDLNFPWK